MGSGKAYSLHETDSTRAASAAQRFDDILDKVEEAGGEILTDEEVPLYIDLGPEEAEVGLQRVAEFNINKTDFQMTRKIEDAKITGDGVHKQLEPLDPPRIKISLKTKPQLEDDWTIVDLDDMF
ncbi:hypothetical protein HOE67_04275 [Candidatus Peregrinibacteria bacterium]|jgi:hypothetical protein|nr:hypothetical protein [Candidatus Peregrinibacteria bacterium]MBT4056299.1 hypothetical protein [Candidatus Peregrinibacteria bacterium]